MDSKRRAVFSARVLHKLFPPTNERNCDKIEEENISASQAMRNKGSSSNSKVYGAYLPPDIRDQLRAADNSSETVLSTSEEESPDSDDEPIQKRRRKKRGKRRVPNEPTDAQSQHCKDNTCSMDNSSRHQGELFESQDTSNLKTPSTDNTKHLTKNQKRKLRKKRRRNIPGHQATEGTSGFTFEQDEDNYPDTIKEEKHKVNICGEVQEFMQAVWDIYSRDRKKNQQQQQQADFDTFLLLLRHLDLETLASLQHWKELLVLQNAAKATEKFQALKDVLSNEHLAVLSTLAEYWLNDVMQVSIPGSNAEMQLLKGKDI